MPNLDANSAARSRLLLPTATTLKLAARPASCNNLDAMPPGPRMPQRTLSDNGMVRPLSRTPSLRSSVPARRPRSGDPTDEQDLHIRSPIRAQARKQDSFSRPKALRVRVGDVVQTS